MGIRIAAALALIAVLAMAGAAIYSRLAADDRFAACREGIISGEAALDAAFSLTDETGRTVTEADILDKPALVYFGYTFCPDVCPIDNARNAEAADLLGEMGKDVRPVFITVDPARDTQEVVADYTDLFHEDMIGLTGTAEEVAEAARNFRVYFKAHDTGDAYYLVDHTAFTYLTLPGEGVVDFFRREDSARAVADRTACYVDRAS